jgi:hypothetical protein
MVFNLDVPDYMLDEPEDSWWSDEEQEEESLEEIADRVGRWMPEIGQRYFTFENDYSDIWEDTWEGSSDEIEIYEAGEVFATADEALTALRKKKEDVLYDDSTPAAGT